MYGGKEDELPVAPGVVEPVLPWLWLAPAPAEEVAPVHPFDAVKPILFVLVPPLYC